ncbi:MAG TPA: hypothetical protein VGG03_01495 [Thermoanaerobaculia bacterium]|jgi:hypothetical protein
MSEAEAAAREQLRGITAELEAIRFRLLGVQASLPESPAEHVHFLEEEPMDTRTEIRAVIGCVLEDRLTPAIQDLREIAALRPGS